MLATLLINVYLALASVANPIRVPELQFGRTRLKGHAIPSLEVDFYGGIPFAEPPLGSLRFRPTVLKTQLNVKTFDASSFGKSCLQPPVAVKAADLSEDCLTINIFKPASIAKTARLPVLFWTYGGAWTFGSSAQYNGSDLVAQSIARGTPIIYVNFNYRLGPFGWPQGQESEDRRLLNLGLHDQIAALKWVQHNIHHFGGDKRKVTAFGESAGSIMTALLYLDNQLDGLARAAIFQSGQANSVINPKAAFRDDVWQGLIKNVPSCSATSYSNASISCLRGAPTEEIFTAWLQVFGETSAFILYFPTIDPGPNSLFKDFPSRIYPTGRFSRLPFIAGTNLDEGTLFALRPLNTTEIDIKNSLINFNSPPTVDADKLELAINSTLALYPDIPALGSPFNTGDNLFGLSSSYKRHAAIFTDLSFDSPRRMWMQYASTRGIKVYGYHFTQPQRLDDPSLGVTHGSEIPFVYGQPADQSPIARRISTTMMDYWISFATTLDPNDNRGLQRPVWPRYTPSNKVLLQLHETNTTSIPDSFREKQIGFFNDNPIPFRH